MSISNDFNSLPNDTKNSLILGIVLALTIALPLFVWTALYTNFNVGKKAADDGSNYCGGTCGSNFNCQPNLYCYKGFCRNPICSDDTDCTCSVTTSTTTPTMQPLKPTTKATSTITPNPKGGNENYSNLINTTPAPSETSKTITENRVSVAPENQFFAKYAIYIFGAFVIIIILTIYYTFKRKKNTDIPHILPPTNI